MIADALLINAAAFLALFVRFEFDFEQLRQSGYMDGLVTYSWLNTLGALLIFYLMKLYDSLWEFASTAELIRVFVASVISAGLCVVGMMMLKISMPRSFVLLYAGALTALCSALRLLYRELRRARMRSDGGIRQKRTMLIGGGQAGSMVLREFQFSAHSENNVVCIIDDDRSKHGSYMRGVKIVGGRDDILQMAEKYGVEEIVLAIPSASRRERLDILDICHLTGCSLRTLPGLYQLANGEVSIQSIKHVDIEDLLGRDTVKTDLNEVKAYVQDKVVLVTGGGGSIGSELCRQAAAMGPKQLIVFDIYENNAYDLQMELRHRHPELDLVVLIGSVRDETRVNNIFAKYHPDLVCHAAAHKHVPLMEDSPFEAIKNNVFGTYNVARAADRFGTQRFILISTDKAVNPTNVMGASKRICEMVVQTVNERSKTEFVAVRFGNVLGSAGSVIPLFRKQIKEGGPVTVTHKEVIRYFMTIPEAVQLIFQANAYANGGAKKLSAAAIAIILVVVMAIGGTVALLMDSTDSVTNKFAPASSGITIEEKVKENCKTEIAVKNTGDTGVYVRVSLVANYYDDNGNITGGAAVPDFTLNSDKWFVGNDGYYYYKQPVAAGDVTDNLLASGSKMQLEDNMQVTVLAQSIQASPTSVVHDKWGVTVNSDGTLAK